MAYVFTYRWPASLPLALQVNPDQIITAGIDPMDDPDCGEHAMYLPFAIRRCL